MANTKISQLTATTSPTGGEELVYAYNNANGKMTLDTMKTYAGSGKQDTLVSGTNIKTINGDSILGSGNLVVSGGGGISTLSADANIWELSDGIYETEYDLYYMTGQEVPRGSGSGLQYKQMISVVQGAGGTRGFMVINSRDRTGMSIHGGWAFFGYSNSSSVGECYQLGDRKWAINQFSPFVSSISLDSLSNSTVNQVISDMKGSDTLRISSQYAPYPGLTYTIYIESAASGETYTITTGTGVTNPFGFTLPSNSNKACLITVLITSSTTGIVTGCKIAS